MGAFYAAANFNPLCPARWLLPLRQSHNPHYVKEFKVFAKSPRAKIARPKSSAPEYCSAELRQAVTNTSRHSHPHRILHHKM